MCFISADGSTQSCSCDNKPLEFKKATGKNKHKCKSTTGKKCLNYSAAPMFWEQFEKGDPCFADSRGSRVRIRQMSFSSVSF